MLLDWLEASDAVDGEDGPVTVAVEGLRGRAGGDHPSEELGRRVEHLVELRLVVERLEDVDDHGPLEALLDLIEARRGCQRALEREREREL